MSLASDSAGSLEDGDGIPSPGTIIADKYLIEHKLGKGGMGVVVAARHIKLNHLVAIKFIRKVGILRDSFDVITPATGIPGATEVRRRASANTTGLLSDLVIGISAPRGDRSTPR